MSGAGVFERVELKYLVDDEVRRRLVEGLSPRLLLDPHGDERGSYSVVTLYYDNADLDVYWDRCRGEAFRRKLRVRLYPIQAACYLEVKHRSGSRVAKRRARLPLEDALAACSGGPLESGRTLPDLRVVREAQGIAGARDLQPACLMRYERQAFVGRDDEADLRVTFDSDLRCRFRDLAPRHDLGDFDVVALAAGRSVMEVKVDRAVPWWLSKVVARNGCLLQGVSKYALAVEASGRGLGHPAEPLRRVAR